MDIGTALKIIRRNLRKNTIQSKHFLDQCKERGLDISVINKTVLRNRILGIVEQDEEVYKVWFFYKEHKDLNIILRILSDNRLRFITVFPCYSERRKR